MKSVMIPQYLFTALYKCLVINMTDKCSHCVGCEKIAEWLEEKGEKIYANEQYRIAKTAADPKERERAFLSYRQTRTLNEEDYQ